MEHLGPLLPERHSPLRLATGFGNQKAYLAAIPRELFDVVLSGSQYDVAALARGGSNSLNYEVVTETLDDQVEEAILRERGLDETTRESLVSARRGQGAFRKNVGTIETRCRLTGVSNTELLIASHIKPWRACTTAEERLDGMNGLMLTPDVDHLFDRGYISFDDDGRVLVSELMDREDLRRLGLGFLGPGYLPENNIAQGFKVEQRGYLSFHRNDVFLPG